MTIFSYIFNGREMIAKRVAKKKKEKSKKQSPDSFDGVIFNYEVKNDIQIKKAPEDKKDAEDEIEKKLTVPLFLVSLSVTGYLMFGGYVFTQLGDGWTLVESIYASYQAVSTIGKCKSKLSRVKIPSNLSIVIRWKFFYS